MSFYPIAILIAVFSSGWSSMEVETRLASDSPNLMFSDSCQYNYLVSVKLPLHPVDSFSFPVFGLSRLGVKPPATLSSQLIYRDPEYTVMVIDGDLGASSIAIIRRNPQGSGFCVSVAMLSQDTLFVNGTNPESRISVYERISVNSVMEIPEEKLFLLSVNAHRKAERPRIIFPNPITDKDEIFEFLDLERVILVLRDKEPVIGFSNVNRAEIEYSSARHARVMAYMGRAVERSNTK